MLDTLGNLAKAAQEKSLECNLDLRNPSPFLLAIQVEFSLD